MTLELSQIQENLLTETALSTQDPARDGSNWYAYCSNNPLTFLDPDGCVPRKPTPTMGIAAHFAIIGNLKANDLENGVLAGPQLFLPNPTGEKKGGFFVDYTKPDLKGDTEFYEIKPSSYMKNNRGDKQLEKYINRDGEAVPGTELLSKIAEMEPIKTIMTTPLGTEEITITLSVDPENHPGMIFYDLDDGRTPEEYALKVAEKIVAPVVSAAMIVTGAGAGPEIPSMTAPIPAP